MFNPTTKEIESIMNLLPNERFKYFINKIVDWEEVWGLYNSGWAMTGDNEDKALFPLWPAKKFAECYAIEEWEKYEAKEISIESLKEDVLPTLQEEDISISVFPVPTQNSTSVTIAADKLLLILNDEEEAWYS